MKNASRMFSAAVKTSIERMGNDPATMAAVDHLASSFANIDAMIAYLWKYNDEFGVNGSFIGKSESIEKVTGKPFAYWASLHDSGKWAWGPRGQKFVGYYQAGVLTPFINSVGVGNAD